MILSLIPINRLIVFLVCFYVLLVSIVSAVIAAYAAITVTEAEVFHYSLKGAGILNAALYCMLYFDKPFSWVWGKIESLNDWVFPDLNGTWDMVIEYIDKNTKEERKKVAKAIIKQSLIRTSMEVISDDSDSVTLAISLKKDPESSRKIMYYIYRVEGNNKAHQYVYTGTAKLVIQYDPKIEFSGFYYTDQFRGGNFTLTNRRKL